MILIAPSKNRVVFKHNSVMDEMLEEILSDETLSQVEKDEKIVKLKFNNEKATQVEYFKLLDAHDEAVQRKTRQ
jgi:hypothetical protein